VTHLGPVPLRDQVSAPDAGPVSSSQLEKAGAENRPRPREPQSALVSAAFCLHCGRPLSRLAWLCGGGGRFCSRVHKRKYTHEADQLAMQALAWTQAAGVEPVPRYRLFRKRASPLAGFLRPEPRATVRIAGAFTPARRSLRPFDSYARKLGVSFSSCVAEAPGAVLADAGFLISPISAATVETPLRLSPPQAFRPRRARLPKRSAPKVEFCFVPTCAGELDAAVELIQPEKKVPQARQTAPRMESKVDRIRVAGVSDSEGPMVVVPRETVPSVLGGPVAYKPPTLAESTARSAPGLRRNGVVEQGVFIPRLGMGTLRPRMAFGPSPDKLPSGSGRRNVVEWRIPRPQRSREQDSREAGARALGVREAAGT
jgi:hypothetical protein